MKVMMLERRFSCQIAMNYDEEIEKYGCGRSETDQICGHVIMRSPVPGQGFKFGTSQCQ